MVRVVLGIDRKDRDFTEEKRAGLRTAADAIRGRGFSSIIHVSEVWGMVGWVLMCKHRMPRGLDWHSTVYTLQLPHRILVLISWPQTWIPADGDWRDITWIPADGDWKDEFPASTDS